MRDTFEPKPQTQRRAAAPGQRAGGMVLEPQSPRAFQAAFFQRMGTAQQFRALFEFLPDTDFFAKDTEGRFVAIGAGMLRRVGAKCEEELLGVSDATIHPPFVAKTIREDDLRVMRTRQALVDRVEALYARTRAKDWFLTTKLPMFDGQGEVIGVMGFVRPYHGGSGGGEEDAQMRRVVGHVHEHFQRHIAIADLARIAHLSERQLNRRFQQVFRMSPRDFIVRTRIQAACDALLATDQPLVEIALANGFCDQSAFSRLFRRHMGETPREFRRRRQRALGG